MVRLDGGSMQKNDISGQYPLGDIRFGHEVSACYVL
jgi:hypothetical protein